MCAIVNEQTGIWIRFLGRTPHRDRVFANVLLKRRGGRILKVGLHLVFSS
jgi:3'-phosphoadenosine 5'-phosphosulfate (PAPS) 3'-phosphatase